MGGISLNRIAQNLANCEKKLRSTLIVEFSCFKKYLWHEIFISEPEMALFSPLDAENMILVTISKLAYGSHWKIHSNHIFSISRRKQSHFNIRKQISYQKCFSSHSNSTISVENNYFYIFMSQESDFSRICWFNWKCIS